MKDENKTRFLSLICDMCIDGSLVNLTFSKFPRDGETLKIKARIIIVSSVPAVQFEYFLTEGRVRQKNVKPNCVLPEFEKILSFSPHQADFSGTDVIGTYLVSKKGKTTLITNKNFACLSRKFSDNNREKNYIFDGGEEFMILLGISDKNGRVHDKKQPKFRQINRFCEQVRDIVKYLPKNGTINIADLCCGKSYLSFAVYHYLTVFLKRTVSMVCIDLKKSVIDYCECTARKLSFDGMSFYCMDISTYTPKDPIHLVISLHACDTATDVVLDFAAALRAKVILSTPCCQHELSGIFNCGELDFIGKYSHLKQKLCSVATDALRLERLEASGYKTDAIELIDPEDTPKNTLIRGIMKDPKYRFSEKGMEKFRSYSAHYKYLTGREAKPLPEFMDVKDG